MRGDKGSKAKSGSLELATKRSALDSTTQRLSDPPIPAGNSFTSVKRTVTHFYPLGRLGNSALPSSRVARRHLPFTIRPRWLLCVCVPKCVPLAVLRSRLLLRLRSRFVSVRTSHACDALFSLYLMRARERASVASAVAGDPHSSNVVILGGLFSFTGSLSSSGPQREGSFVGARTNSRQSLVLVTLTKTARRWRYLCHSCCSYRRGERQQRSVAHSWLATSYNYVRRRNESEGMRSARARERERARVAF